MNTYSIKFVTAGGARASVYIHEKTRDEAIAKLHADYAALLPAKSKLKVTLAIDYQAKMELRRADARSLIQEVEADTHRALSRMQRYGDGGACRVCGKAHQEQREGNPSHIYR